MLLSIIKIKKQYMMKTFRVMFKKTFQGLQEK